MRQFENFNVMNAPNYQIKQLIKMRIDKENVIVEKSFRFALEVVTFFEMLAEEKKYVIAMQPLKSGSSIDANTSKAQNAESKADFIHKLKIAAKEADETKYWLKNNYYLIYRN